MYTDGLEFKSGNLVEVLQSLFALILLAPLRIVVIISSKIYFLRNEVIEKILITSCIINIATLGFSMLFEILKSHTLNLLAGKFPIVFRILSAVLSILLYAVIKKFVLCSNNFGLTELVNKISGNSQDSNSDEDSSTTKEENLAEDEEEENNKKDAEDNVQEAKEVNLDDAFENTSDILFTDPVARDMKSFIDNFDEERIDDESDLTAEEEKAISESMLDAAQNVSYIQKDVSNVVSDLESLDSLLSTGNSLGWDTLNEASDL